MPIDLHLAAARLTEHLRTIGVQADVVTVVALDPAANSLLVTIVSAAFDGQTYLDREMRVRGQVARGLASIGHPRTDFVIEPLTPEDRAQQLSVNAPYEDDEEDSPELRIARRDWRDQRQGVIAALEACHYTLSPIEDGKVYIASRSTVSDDRIVVAFAISTKAKTVDLDIRTVIQSARDSQAISRCYYLSPKVLEKPFANQSGAAWLTVETGTSFLHILNASANLASRQIDDSYRELQRLDPEHRGKVVEPHIRRQDNLVETGFFDYIESWLARPEASLLVVMAPAGHGKTTLSLELTRRCAAGFVADPERKAIPLFVPFEAVRRTVDFESLLHKRIAQLGPASLGAYLQLLRRGEAVLFVDGFDELADDAGFEAAEAQVRSMQFLLRGKAKVMLAGRAIFAERFAGQQTVVDRMRSLLGDVSVDVVELLPFDVSNIEEYINTREGLSPAQRSDLINVARSSPDCLELCGNPLFLRILASLASVNKVPPPARIVGGLDVLLEGVCEREEQRQHLGLGPPVQIEFLQWIATECHSHGGGISEGDLRGIAQAIVGEYHPEGGGELVGRLMGHALLRSGGERVAFLHPLIRDIFLGQAVVEQLAKANLGVLGIRDLPEGTALYVASRFDAISQSAAPGWLSKPTIGQMSPLVKRNLFRMASRRQLFLDDGANPRMWLDPQWCEQGKVVGLDISSLSVESLSFDGVRWEGCNLAGAFFEDCDFRGGRFVTPDLRDTTFYMCRAGEGFAVEGGRVERVLVQTDGTAHAFDDGAQLAAAMCETGAVATPVEAPSSKPQVNVRAQVEKIVAGILRRLVDVDPVTQFHKVPIENLHGFGSYDREHTAVDRVILPLVLKSFCSISLGAGSGEMVEIDRRWRSAIVDFVKTARKTTQMRSVFSAGSARAARYLS